MEQELPWLSDTEQHLWRQWLTVNVRLAAALHRQLQNEAGLSLPDFEVLVQLSENSQRRMRVSELANALAWERSRLSHHVARMQKRGLVVREDCEVDARSAFVTLTQEGQSAIEGAAPGHAQTVRSLVFRDLTVSEQESLGSALQKVLANLDRT